ncbi:Inner membrane protein YecN [Microbulbifer aggregans]|uniref:Inner membrane protein YecN n=1 Tax=Microbulbifer aggregans TaxID=1769779 RepID=A0A1C9WAK6_9GAMM|nr:MAPEG family protein [Microbulbifer aggregans]AOS98192.1 Inner membrane protein YecN [Microbulbifer aggregans]
MATVTAFYAALCALLIIALAFRVVKFRRTQKVGLGSGGKHAAEVLIRAHANAVEYVPLALLLLLLAELNGLAASWLHILGGTLLFGRFLHAFGLTAGRGGYHPGRFWGTALTWTVILALAVVLLVGTFSALKF